MKKIKLNHVAAMLLAGALLSGCAGMSKMKKNASDIDYNVTPEILETHAGKVDVEVSVRIPANYFNKKATLIATPVLKFEGGEVAFAPRTLQGEKVQGNAEVVPYEAGKTIKYKGSVDYEVAMRISDLEVRMTAQKGEKSLDFDPVKIAQGVKATATLVQNKPANIIGKDAFQRIIAETKEADLHYLINSANVRWSEMKSEDIKALSEYFKTVEADAKKEYKGIEVSAYASPDGAEDFNEKLAGKREVSSSKYVKKSMKKAKLSDYTSEEFFKSNVTPEDWDGFKKLMQASNIRDKELILRVLSMYTDPEVREKEIRNISAAFSEVKEEILPKLRRAKFLVNVDNIGKSDEKIKDLAKNNPAELNVEELLYAATLTEVASEKLAIYNTAKKQFAADWRAHNDAGMILFGMKKIEEAKANFDKADQLSANNAVVKNNLGAVELVNGNVAEAEVLFGAATGAGKEVNYNLGIVAIKKAQYDLATQQFGECYAVNSALANILAGKYTVALEKLNKNTSDDAMVDYLKAIVGARTNNNNLIFSNLKSATAKDASLKAFAKSDLEFYTVFENAEFKAIVE
ncbi:hypothetical protein DWB61_04220 [Ancylomarina euxinus]|uniref:Uncharacterized protein n=1 Tax=Ancylomarina euxinus TaxID=2283627 RepID=A0A425Y532_9BACT|nr:hypothetical protein [Ancylomarina euxinus]MCZ4694381.1 hypothetical protein [Ancylomarina euxinus]MUP14288.1 hypothetical protein [Ancylomarina euxinus]RRG23606.1 hypothetical protein DWB61_04220 [Ancylomarina euxinus]